MYNTYVYICTYVKDTKILVCLSYSMLNPTYVCCISIFLYDVIFVICSLVNKKYLVQNIYLPT